MRPPPGCCSPVQTAPGQTTASAQGTSNQMQINRRLNRCVCMERGLHVAEMFLLTEKSLHRGLEPFFLLARLSARMKSCPDTKRLQEGTPLYDSAPSQQRPRLRDRTVSQGKT